ncbi:wing blister isoform X1 [Rhipicephalus microplus]|uniref:wing blister isoform X1 n=1 Tax=Rhipicephalus microplus TaxID=6941 RepID=UPI003F6B7292
MVETSALRSSPRRGGRLVDAVDGVASTTSWSSSARSLGLWWLCRGCLRWCTLLALLVVAASPCHENDCTWNVNCIDYPYPTEKGLYPSEFNLASNAGITVNATCGETGPDNYCKLVEHTYNREPQCGECDATSRYADRRHPIQYAIDGSNRWWQSPSLQHGRKYQWVTITLDLKQVFQVTYVIVKSAISPRPGNWILERSIDGVFYRPWQYYAVSDGECWEAYGIAPTPGQPVYKTDDEVICTSYYSSITPLEDGEIHTSLITGRPGAEEFSEKLMDFTKARYVRLRLQRIRTLNADLMSFQTNGDSDKLDKSIARRYFYSIKDISIGGQCVCSGHAKECPSKGSGGELQCRCEHNTCGASCERCCPLFNQQPWRMGTAGDAAECEECECFGHAQSCIYDAEVARSGTSLNKFGEYDGGGVCQNCSHNTAGINCERCEDGYFRPRGVPRNHRSPCRKCSCSGPGTTGSCIGDDSHVQEGLHPGDCICREGFTGPKCDQCKRGYRNYPRCEPCPCHYAGTVNPDQCDGPCQCKKHVEGSRCDQCAHGFYDLSETNPEGCSSCFCFGVTSVCRPSNWGIETIKRPNTGAEQPNTGAKQPNTWTITNLHGSRTVRPTPENGRLTIANDDVNWNMYYWQAPDQYLGNKLYSYGGDLKFMLSYVVARGDTSGSYVEGSDVIIEGDGKRFGYNWSLRPSPDNVTIAVPLREHGWHLLDDKGRPLRPASREEFTLALHDMERLLLRAKYHSDQIEGAMHHVDLPVASKTSGTLTKMTSVEMCQCPVGYAGLSCELCAPGYRRVNNTLLGGRCEKCDCNNHADSCDPYTGKCDECLHNTTGPNCNECLPGFYGNAVLGFTDDCKPCSCPPGASLYDLPSECRTIVTPAGESDYVCLECPPNHAGNKCERCADGFFGNPAIPGEPCRPCRCGPNADTSVPGYCDHRTGRCLRCRGNTGGWNCLECLDGYFGNPATGDCRPCDCSVTGSISQVCNKTTGQCPCKPSFSGRTCDRCQDGFGGVERGCTPCRCNLQGSVSERCDPITGNCICRPGVFGTLCDSCLEGHYGFSLHLDGCKWCGCDPHGSLSPECDENTGQCPCKPNVVGRTCDRCKPGYWNLASPGGCEPCHCNTTGSVSTQCDDRTGQCPCKPGVGGTACDVCLPGYFRFSHHGCRACEPCEAPGHVCDEETGRCICPKNTGGPRCNRCNTGAWGYHPVDGCKLCNCNKLGSLSPNCDENTGQCQCLEGFEGQHCDHCRPGYYNFPNCQRCDCHPAGTDPGACHHGICQCDERGQCPCKANVEGRRCDRCRDRTFSLLESNPRGCTECFMFGRTDQCTQANLVWGVMRTPPRDITITPGEPEFDRVHRYKVIPGTHPGSTLLPGPYVLDQPLYWSLPEPFLGDKVLAYNGKLKFTVESDAQDVFPDAMLRQYPLVFLQGNHRILLGFHPHMLSPNGAYVVPIHEDAWYQVDNPQVPVTRAMLMVALQNVQRILIRANDGPDVRFASLKDVSLEIARPPEHGEVTPYMAYGVEQGRCPIQYTGSSCQDPNEGYWRKFKHNYLNSRDILDLVGWAEPCDCNNRTRTCHKETGVCINCGGNTVGDHCERCAEGFFGTPSRGPCLPCACPLPTNSFSSTCQTHGPDYICTDCQEGYTGRRCERCADGFFGNPLVDGGRCERCECNPYGSQGHRCDPTTGACHCLPGITGRDCSICPGRHILTEYGCKSCDDDCTGRLLDEVEHMLALLNRLNATDIISAPWIHLLAIQETTRVMRTDLDNYLHLVDSGNQVLSNFSFHFNLETQAEILLERSKDMVRTLPGVAHDVSHLLQRARELLELVKKYYDEIRAAVDYLKLQGFWHNGTATGIDRLVEEAQRILSELQRRNFDRPMDESNRENRKAHQLLERVRNLLFNLQEVGDMAERLDRIEQLLSEMVRRIQNEVQNPTARALDLLERELQTLQSIQNFIGGSQDGAGRANASLVEAREWLRKARDAIIDAAFKFDELPRLLMEISNATDALEERRGTLDRLNPEYRDKYVAGCKRHADDMGIRVGALADQFRTTQEVSEYPLRAARVYQNIVDALHDAEEAAGKAADAADRAFDEAYPRAGDSLMHQAESARERSEDLLRQAKQLRDEDIPELQYTMRVTKSRLKGLGEDFEDGNQAVAAINRELDRLPTDISGPLEDTLREANRADGKQKGANNFVDGIVGRLPGLIAKVETLKTGSAEGLDNLTRLIDEAHRGIKQADQLASRSEQSAARARQAHNMLQLNLKELRDKILLARQRASSIRVSLSADSNDQCSRSFKPEIESTMTNSIILNYAIKEDDQNSLLFFLANSKGKDDFMAIEMVNRKIKFSWNAGGGTHSITHSMHIETNDPQLGRDSNWYKVEVFRVGNVATLSVKRKPDGARDDPEEITGAAPAGFGKMDLDSSSYFYVGSVPDNISAAQELTARTFVGCLHEVILDGKQVGLWNFLTNEGCDGCKSGPTEDVDPSAFHFKGEGYSILPQIRRYQSNSYYISLLIKTFDEDALLFIAPNTETGEFVSLGLRGGHVVFQFKMSNSAPMELRTKRRYNSGNWTRVIAERDKQEGVLSVEDELLQGQLPRRSSNELQLQRSNLYFGAVPPDFDTSKFSTVGFQNYIGCMKNPQVETTTLDLLKYEAYGVDPGCSEKKVKLVSFKGTGYLELKGKTLAAEGNFGFTFQSMQTDGLIMISTFSGVRGADSKRDHYYSVALKDGHIELRLNGGAGEVASRSEQRYNDNKFHTITIIKRHRKIQVNVDDAEIDSLRLPKGTTDIEGPGMGGLFFGGVRGGIAIGDQAATRDNFIGTIKDAVFNDVLLGFNFPVSHEGAGIGRLLKRPRPMPPEHDRMAVLTEQQLDQCSEKPPHDLDDKAFKFGDTLNSHVEMQNVIEFRNDFNVSLELRTYYPNGVLLLAQAGSYSRQFSLVLSGGRVLLQVTDRGMPKKLHSHGGLNDGHWHHVGLSKEGSRLILSVDDKAALKLQVHRRMPFRGPLYVGGIASGLSVPEDLVKESFKGCIRNFNVNSRSVDLASGKSQGVGQCFANIELGAFFQGDAYAVYDEQFNVDNKLEVQLEFRTWRLNGVLMSLSEGAYGAPSLAMELLDGEVIVSVDLGQNGTGPFRARKKFGSRFAMCDGQWHQLRAHFSRNEISLRIDRDQVAYGLAPVTPAEPHTESPLYIGGLPEGSSNDALFGRDNFVGCLRNLAINDKRIDWIDMASLHDVLPNSCPAK